MYETTAKSDDKPEVAVQEAKPAAVAAVPQLPAHTHPHHFNIGRIIGLITLAAPVVEQVLVDRSHFASATLENPANLTSLISGILSALQDIRQ